jgi:uncharacterized protein (TIGR02145 family)
MSRNICTKPILKAANIAIFAVLFYTVCDDNSVNVVTPEVTTFEDKRDGKIYKKVQIGSQIWMAENLRYEADGSRCVGGGGDGTTHILEFDPERNVYIYKEITLAEFCDIYGRLYDWPTAMNGEHSSNSVPSGIEGVCPVGWHIPSDAEWQTLIDYVGENAGTKLKSRDWKSGGTGPGGMRVPDGTDKYRFSALPSGYAAPDINGKTVSAHFGWNGFWWSATERESGENQVWRREIMGTNINVMRGSFEKHYYLSVRCVHD